MLKGSFSSKRDLLRLLVVLLDDDVRQKVLFSSVGEGGMKTPLSLISINLDLANACREYCYPPDIPLNLYSTADRSLLATGLVAAALTLF